mgnify:CR=1 FL=1
MEVVLIWKLSFSTRAWHSIRFSTQAPLHALFIPVLIGLCSYKNVLAIWRHSRWKLTLTQIVSAFSFVLTAILNSQEGCRCTLVLRLPFPVPRSPFLVPGISNIQTLLFRKILRAICVRLSLWHLRKALRWATGKSLRWLQKGTSCCTYGIKRMGGIVKIRQDWTSTSFQGIHIFNKSPPPKKKSKGNSICT